MIINKRNSAIASKISTYKKTFTPKKHEFELDWMVTESFLKSAMLKHKQDFVTIVYQFPV